jgi:hypothetical protein
LDKIQFYGVNYQTDLLNCWILENVVKVRTTTTRGVITLFRRDNPYIIPLHLPKKCTSFDKAKASILSVFTLPSFTFIVCDKIIYHCTQFQNKVFPSFIGHFQNDSCVSDTEWDFSDTFLIGKIYKNIVYLFNDSFCIITNQYPEIGNGTKENMVIGTGYNYSLAHTPLHEVSTITYAHSSGFVAPEISGNSVYSVFFKELIPIQNTSMVFMGVVHPIFSKKIKSYAMVGFSSFKNTKTMNTISLEIEYVDEKDDTFQNEDGMFFKFIEDKIVVFRNGFLEFITKHKSRQTLSNIHLYDSNKFQYDPAKNRLLSKMAEMKKKIFGLFHNEKIKEYYNNLPYRNNINLPKKDKQSILLKYFGKPYSTM